MSVHMPLSVRSAWARQVLFPAEGMLRGIPLTRRFREFSEAQWWPQAQLDAYREKKLRRLIAHAYDTVPFYRRRMDRAGVRPDQIRQTSDLQRLPVLRREEVIAHVHSMISTAVDRSHLRKGSSSGSTGRVVTSYHTAESLGAAFAAERVGWSMAGYPFGARRCVVWGNPVAVNEQWSRPGSRLKQWAYGERRIPAFGLSDSAGVESALRLLKDLRPDYLWGYPNAIYFLALKARDAGVDDLSCAGVLTTAETVYDHQREVIADVFGPVFDGYGSGEVPGVAYQCLHGAYHVVEPHVMVEYGVGSAEDPRELLLTDLDNFGMPLIRYAVGDLAVADGSPCACGRTWETMKRVAGRTADLITLPGGGALLIPSFFGSSLLKRLPSVRQYQIAKVAPDRIVLRLAVTRPLAEGERALLRCELDPYLGGKVAFEIEEVEKLQLTSSGKFKLVVDETKVR